MGAIQRRKSQKVTFSDRIVSSVVEVPNKCTDKQLKNELLYSKEEIQSFNLLVKQQKIFQAMVLTRKQKRNNGFGETSREEHAALEWCGQCDR